MRGPILPRFCAVALLTVVLGSDGCLSPCDTFIRLLGSSAQLRGFLLVGCPRDLDKSGSLRGIVLIFSRRFTCPLWLRMLAAEEIWLLGRPVLGGWYGVL